MPNWRDTLKKRELGECPGFPAANVALEDQEAQLSATSDDAFAPEAVEADELGDERSGFFRRG